MSLVTEWSPVESSAGTDEGPIRFEEALGRVLDAASPLDHRSYGLDDDPRGLFLAEPLLARADSPSFDASAVDGYGVRRADLPGRLRLVGSVAAGDAESPPVGPGQAVRVLTGARVPPGVDAVAMQEACRVRGGWVDVAVPAARTHIRLAGEEYRSGDELLAAGTEVTAPVLGLLAANGRSGFIGHRRPRVELVVTGDELRMPEDPLPANALYASHGPQLAQAARGLGAECRWGLAPDEPGPLRERLRAALGASDVLITTGGVSVGDRDLVKETLESLGVERAFWRVRMKPGKPVYFGMRGKTLVFGLPGSPLAAVVGFQLFVAPTIRRLLGANDPVPPTLPVRLGASIGKALGRTEFVAVRLDARGDALVAHPIEGPGSHGLLGGVQAHGLIRLDEGTGAVYKGDPVRVLPLG